VPVARGFMKLPALFRYYNGLAGAAAALGDAAVLHSFGARAHCVNALRIARAEGGEARVSASTVAAAASDRKGCAGRVCVWEGGGCVWKESTEGQRASDIRFL
jgi:hypothetical protein